jgi:Domain of unknown function (DUF4331)
MHALKRAPSLAILAALCALVVALVSVPNGAGAADHLDAPGLMSPGGKTKSDINDLYVFTARNENRTVLAMTVNPVATEGTTFGMGFSKSYSLRVDTDGDGVEEITYHVRVFPADEVNGTKKPVVLIERAKGKHARGAAPDGDVQAIGSVESTIKLRGGGRAYAGLRSDPFFFDLSGFLGTVEGVGEDSLGDDPTDFFSDLNALAIVLELPDRRLNDGGPIGVWATTQAKSDGHWQQVDRMGRPAINTVVDSSGPIVGADSNAKNVFNAGKPKHDSADFRSAVIHALKAFSSLDSEGAYSTAQAGALADVLLPDILVFDKSGSLPPPLNGRGLADDVIDTELRIVTGGDPLGLFSGRDADGGVNGDGVGAHSDYKTKFPYLGKPH